VGTLQFWTKQHESHLVQITLSTIYWSNSLSTINVLLELYLFNFVGYVGNTKQGNVGQFLIQLFKT